MSSKFGKKKAKSPGFNRETSNMTYSLDENDARKVDVLLDLHEQQLGLVEKADLAAAIVESYRRAGDSLHRFETRHLYSALHRQGLN